MGENQLQSRLRARIAAHGPLAFRDFMEAALYDPEHGYYSTGRAEIGRRGDYFTSVSVGPLFGELWAWQFRQMWELLGRPGDFTIVEQGANDGALAADVLGWARRAAPEFWKALRYQVVEPFEPQRKRQSERLAAFVEKVTWRRDLEELEPFTGVHFSNELVDAFPVHLVRCVRGEWRERHLDADFQWVDLPITHSGLSERLAHAPLLEGYTTEVNLEAAAWAALIAARLRRGWVVVVDYGYARASYHGTGRTQGTLQAYAAHARQPDVVAAPGRCDLTAHVEFTSLAEAFQQGGLDVAGFTDQHHALVGLSAHALASGVPNARTARALRTLLHPELLGTRFQVLTCARQVPAGVLASLQYAGDAKGALGLA